MSTPSAADARAFLAQTEFIWHQRWELVPGVETPGAHDLGFLFDEARIPERLDGRTALDIGTSNGGAAFLLERAGADVVAVDIYPQDWFGFGELSAFLGSRVEYVHATVYELPRRLVGRTFDLILFWGVLYHLRHPLLALDAVRALLVPGGEVSIETAVSDDELPALADLPVARFYARDELHGDPSNWFSPTVACLREWCSTSGLVPATLHVWGEGPGRRCIAGCRPSADAPEYARISYEVPLMAEPVTRVGP